MNDATPKSPRRWPLRIAVAASLISPIGGTIIGIVFREMVILPGALVSLAFYGVLGYLAIRGRVWARWVIFAFLLGTAMMGFGIMFVAYANSGWLGAFIVLGATIFYVFLAVLVALPSNKIQRENSTLA